MTILTAALAIAMAIAAHAQTTPHHPDVNARGTRVMGFDQENTAHHFFLYADGGALDVSVKVPTDTTNLDAIRAHLPHIALMFGQGRFDAPLLVHDSQVPGTPEMTRLKDRLTYTYVETPLGGRVDILTKDPDALAAVHRFLKFQIADHQTGDAIDIRKR